MALNDPDVTNFETMREAAEHGRLALVESRDSAGRYVALICCLSDTEDGQIMPVPFAEMVRGNPFEMYADPTQETLPEAVA